MCSGNSLRNRDWANEARDKLGKNFERFEIINYLHWDSGEQWIDLDSELSKLTELPNGLGEYGMFAKSIGTVLAARAIEQQILSPKFLLLCGLPMGYINDKYRSFANVISRANIPTSIIQNDQDPVGSSQEVLDYLGNSFERHPNFSFKVTHANSHEYLEYMLLEEELTRLGAGSELAEV